MDRIAKFDIVSVLPHIHKPAPDKPDRKNYIGHNVKMVSIRLNVFKRNLECVNCGLRGSFFALERHTDECPHFNLYAIDDNENEVLMTKDHIIPKSKGGSDHYENMQTMCAPCNEAKAN